MPIYEYRCGECGRKVEVLVRRGGEPPTCPDCATPLTDKLFSVPFVSHGQDQRAPGHTCCGREERCDSSPCSSGEPCRRGH